MKRSQRFLKTFKDLLSSLNTNSHLELSLQKFQHFPKNDLSDLFFHMSQGQNALPWPVLEPESSDSEPSALTTGLLDKAVALACPRYSWPRMLKVAPCMGVQSYGCTVVQSYGHTVVQLYCHTSKFFRLDGFLLFCIIMGLSYAFGNVSVKQGCHRSIFSSMRN